MCDTGRTGDLDVIREEVVRALTERLRANARGLVADESVREELCGQVDAIVGATFERLNGRAAAAAQPGGCAAAPAPVAGAPAAGVSVLDAPALTSRELEVLRMIARAYTNRDIAAELHIVQGTVKRHATNIYGKLGATSRIDAVLKARELGLLRE